MIRVLIASGFLVLLLVTTVRSQEYRIEKIDAAPESDDVSAEIMKRIDAQGLRVVRGTSRTVCEIWLCKEIAADPDFKATLDRLYPFTAGQLIGVLHLGRRGAEFRDQQVSSGWYTLRFALQPVDGNHVGTSPTRDFLLMVDAQQDDLPDTWPSQESLQEASAEAAGSSHPAMLCLQRPSDAPSGSIRHDEANDWWVVHLNAKTGKESQRQSVPLDLVVVGHAAE